MSQNQDTTQKMKFSIKSFFSKYDQIRRKLRIWSHLQKKSFMENFIFCAVIFTTGSTGIMTYTIMKRRKKTVDPAQATLPLLFTLNGLMTGRLYLCSVTHLPAQS